MSIAMQNAIVGLIVLAAAAYVGFVVYRTLAARKSDCGCGKSGACGAAKLAQKKIDGQKTD